MDQVTGEKKQVLSFLGDGDNVKDFYVLLNRHGINTIPVNSSLHIFRKHVKPEWEDKHNIDGGHLRVFANIQLGETPEMASKRLSCLWFDVLRSVIGEHFQQSDQVVGVGYTNKSHRPIMSVWLSNTDPESTLSIRNDVFQLFSVSTGMQHFSARFYSHKGLAKNETGFKAEEVSWHRRIQSAPTEAYLTIGDEEDEAVSNHSDAKSEDLQGSREVVSGKRSPCRGSPKAKRQSDEDAGVSIRSPEKESPTNLLQRRGVNLGSQSQIVREHIRSRTESHAAEAIVSQPIKPQDGSVHIPSVAPTPIKDWTTDWSPSTFTAAQQQRSGNFAAARLAAQANTFPGAALPRGPPRAIGATPEVGSTPQSMATAVRSQPPSKMPAPPLPVAPSPSIAKAPAKPMIVDPNQLSDRLPFICKGFTYPPRMNRKDYRAIIFAPGPPPPYDGAFPAPPELQDGDLTIEQFEALKSEFLKRPLDVN